MIYLTMHSTQFIYGYMEGWKEGSDLLNDALNTFYLQLYGIRHDLSIKCLNSYCHRAMTHLIAKQKEEGNVLFNDALNTFYLRLYGVRHMVKDNSDSERGNLLLQYGLLFSVSSKCSCICTIPKTSHGELAGTRIAQWVHSMKDRSDDPSRHKRTLLPRSYSSLRKWVQRFGTLW